ncbi:TIGR04282 family arsenosugar biosynthesis glycosyltransferase [Streptomyces hydrogenans]
MTALLVIAKQPLPGRVKTRLTPPFTPVQAAALAEAALADTLAVAARVPAARHVLVLDGEPGAWLPPCFEVVSQVAGGLDVRLAAAFAGCDGPALLIGMDTPQITPGSLTGALRWDAYDAWFGPAADGGFWALGLRSPEPSLLLGVPMSRADTGGVLFERLRAAGLRTGRLPVLRDVDTAEDARHVAAEATGTRFAALHAVLAPARAGAET